MTGDAIRWVFAVVLILCILGLVLYARGTTHHRGEDVGAIAFPHAVSYALER